MSKNPKDNRIEIFSKKLCLYCNEPLSIFDYALGSNYHRGCFRELVNKERRKK